METGCYFVQDILDCTGNNFLPYATFIEKFQINTTFINYFGVITAIKATRRSLTLQLQESDKDSRTVAKM